jgi:hypothetical protein
MDYVRTACENYTLSNIGHGSRRYRQGPNHLVQNTLLTSARHGYRTAKPGSDETV